jgi:hypothetical protein
MDCAQVVHCLQKAGSSYNISQARPAPCSTQARLHTCTSFITHAHATVAIETLNGRSARTRKTANNKRSLLQLRAQTADHADRSSCSGAPGRGLLGQRLCRPWRVPWRRPCGGSGMVREQQVFLAERIGSSRVRVASGVACDTAWHSEHICCALLSVNAECVDTACSCRD